MKLALAALLRVLVVGTVLWIALFLRFPSHPPGPSESVAIVIVALGIERLGTWLHRRLRRRRPPSAAAVLALLSAGAWLAGAPGAAVGAEESETVLVCHPDRPAVGVGGRVELRAFVVPTPEAAMWSWEAPVGTIEGSGDRVTWVLGESEPGYYEATGRMRTGEDEELVCSVRIRVRTGTKGATSLSGRSLLVCGEGVEGIGYGLYSYLLFPARPSTPEVEDRYRATLRAFVDLVPDVEAFQLELPRREVHVTYLPSEERGEVPKRSADATEWLLEHYRWSCAHELLARVPGDHHGTGPYLVSLRRGLVTGGPIRPGEEYLYQDLSRVSADLVDLWLREFLVQTRQVDFAQPRTGPRLALELRTAVSVLGEAIGAVRPAVSDWLRWFEQPTASPAPPPGAP